MDEGTYLCTGGKRIIVHDVSVGIGVGRAGLFQVIGREKG